LNHKNGQNNTPIQNPTHLVSVSQLFNRKQHATGLAKRNAQT